MAGALGLSPGFSPPLLPDVDGSPLADVDLGAQPGLNGGRNDTHGRGDGGGGGLQRQSAVLTGA